MPLSLGPLVMGPFVMGPFVMGPYVGVSCQHLERPLDVMDERSTAPDAHLGWLNIRVLIISSSFLALYQSRI